MNMYSLKNKIIRMMNYNNLEHTLKTILHSKIRIVLGNLNTKTVKENIFRVTIVNRSIHLVRMETSI